MIRIITDSTCDLTPAKQEAYGVQVVPLTVNFGPDKVYKEGPELPPEVFFEKLAECEKLPTTSQPAPEEFLSRFLEAKQAGDEVVAVLVSSRLSGTFQSAQLAAELSDWSDHIHLVDSLNVTLGLQMLVRRAVTLRSEGLTAAEIAARLEEERADLRVYALVDTLKYLQKGGRLSKTTAVAGTLLGIKPVVAIVDGKVEVVGKARGLAGAYVTVFKQINGGDESLDGMRPWVLGYTGKRAGLQPFRQYICDNLGLPDPGETAIGAVIGTHVGPGACGIAYFAKKSETAQ